MCELAREFRPRIMARILSRENPCNWTRKYLEWPWKSVNFVNSHLAKKHRSRCEKRENTRRFIVYAWRCLFGSVDPFQLARMAKSNKEKATKAMDAAQKLQKQTGQNTTPAAAPVATPARAAEESKPVRRITSKRGGEVSEAVEEAKRGRPAEPEVDFEISWNNIDKVMAKFGITEKQATQVLLKLVGPNPAGERFWTGYKRRIGEEVGSVPVKKEKAVKKEPVDQVADDSQFPDTQVNESQMPEEAEPPQPPKRRRLRQLFECDKADQCDDEPDIWAEDTETEAEVDPVDEEIDPKDNDGDHLSEDEFDPEMAATGHGGDAPSPDSGHGGVQETQEVPQVVCSKQPAEPEEPVRPLRADLHALAA